MLTSFRFLFRRLLRKDEYGGISGKRFFAPGSYSSSIRFDDDSLIASATFPTKEF
jgi:hypothetical protein